MDSPESLATLELRLASQQESLGKNHLDVADTFAQLAAAYVLAKQPNKAETAYWRVIEIRQQAEGGHPELASCLEDLARLYDQQFREMEADRLRELAKSISTTIKGSQESAPPVKDAAPGSPSVAVNGAPGVDSSADVAKSGSILNMDIGQLLKQANVILNSPVGILPDKPIAEVRSEESEPGNATGKPGGSTSLQDGVPSFGHFLKQANAILNTPVGISSKPAEKPIEEVRSEESELGNATGKPAGSTSLQDSIPNIGQFLKQANAILNAPVGGPGKRSEKPVEEVQSAESEPVNLAAKPSDVNTLQDSVPVVVKADTPAKSVFSPVSEEHLFTQWQEEVSTNPDECPHGQSLSLDPRGCLLCRAIGESKSGSSGFVVATGFGSAKASPTTQRRSNVNQEPVSALVLEPGGDRFSLKGVTLWIGVSAKCDVILKQADLPLNYQATVSLDGEEFWLRELSSENKATINGAPMTSKLRLYRGDVIQIGSTRIRVD